MSEIGFHIFCMEGVTDMQERKIKLSGMKEVSEFVRTAGKCDFDIDVFYNHVYVDGKSILGILGLDLARVLTVRYNGTDPEFEQMLDKFAAVSGFAA